MTERIDHAAEALGWRELVNDQYERGCPDHEKVVEYSTIMQASATLALAEQQRIANLLSLLKPRDPREYDVWPDIAAALGIQEVQS